MICSNCSGKTKLWCSDCYKSIRNEEIKDLILDVFGIIIILLLIAGSLGAF